MERQTILTGGYIFRAAQDVHMSLSFLRVISWLLDRAGVLGVIASVRRCVIAVSVGTALMGGLASAQFCVASANDNSDSESCDSLDLGGDCHVKRLRQFRTVGALFRWSDDPAASELPQPDAPMVTNRPSFTAASSVVGWGVFQIESGYQYTSDSSAAQRQRTHTYPNTQFRYGIFANWLELQCAFDFTSQSLNGIESTSADDLVCGLKIGLTPQDEWRPQMALISQMSVGVDRGSDANQDVLPGVNWIYSWKVRDSLSITGSTQFNRAIDNGSDATYTQWAQSGLASYSLSDRVSSYGEFYGLYPSNAENDDVQHYFDAGLLYLLSNNVQWDIRGGVGLNDQADDYFVGSGLSVRFR